MTVLFNDATRAKVGSDDFLDVLCFRHQRHNILALRESVGDEPFLAILDHFAGTYVRFPTAGHSVDTANEIHLARLYENMRKKAKSGAKDWNDVETKFINLATRMGYGYERAVRRAKALLHEIDEARQWRARLRQADKVRSDE